MIVFEILLPEDAYAVYARLAARKGRTVSQYLTDTARAHTARTAADVTGFLTDVARLNAIGWDDGRISVATNRTRQQVAAARKKLGLSPNKRKDG